MEIERYISIFRQLVIDVLRADTERLRYEPQRKEAISKNIRNMMEVFFQKAKEEENIVDYALRDWHYADNETTNIMEFTVDIQFSPLIQKHWRCYCKTDQVSIVDVD